MALFKDTNGKIRLDYMQKMIQAETMWQASVDAGNAEMAEFHRKKMVAYATALTAVSTVLLTK